MEKPHFRVSPAVLGPLGVEQLQDPALAVLELIKNSWDADATRVKVVVDQRTSPATISVTDDGHGMSVGDFRDRWLVIGRSHKRTEARDENRRPLIGEKGLGRLASFALGQTITIRSAPEKGKGFIAEVDWKRLTHAPSLEEYKVPLEEASVPKGTRVLIRELKAAWEKSHTDFLISHVQFLASLPGEDFRITIRVDGKRQPIEDALATIDRLAEGSLSMKVGAEGRPRIVSCIINGTETNGIVLRAMKDDERDPRLTGVTLTLKFFRRDQAAKRLENVLEQNEVADALERYQGIRIFRDGINVPPYGLNLDDWAGLEKQRTATGGPTLVPGNSQLVGELHVSRRRQAHLVITAGRSGFTDQAAVASLARYVRWAVRLLGTARRAEYLGIVGQGLEVPARVDDSRKGEAKSDTKSVKAALASVARAKPIKADPALRQQIEEVSQLVTSSLNRSEETLRLYAQLASTGIAATSFSHELRADFDVVSEAIAEIKSSRRKPDSELLELLNASWARIRSFAALFKVIPVKIRRHRQLVSTSELRTSAQAILGLAQPEKVSTTLAIPSMRLNVVPAEVDSILLNLVSNSAKGIAASSNRESGRIRVRYETSGRDLSIAVADNGCGITPKVAQIMFEPLEGRFAEGTGMGLPIVKYIAERYHGRVQARKLDAEGLTTEFLVSLRNVVH